VYQAGYIDGSAFTAQKKTNEAARVHSQAVANGTEALIDFGFKEPSSIAKILPGFDLVYGHMIECFHDMRIVRVLFFCVFSPFILKLNSLAFLCCQNCPKTFWKSFVFEDYDGENNRPAYVMAKANRTIFSARIKSIQGTHDMEKRPKDPSSQKMKGCLPSLSSS